MEHHAGKRLFLSLFLLIGLNASCSETDMAIDFDKVFQKAVESEGGDYLAARDQLILAANGDVFLKKEIGNPQWERRWVARIADGWRTNAPLYDRTNSYIDGKITGPLPITGKFGIDKRAKKVESLGADVVPRLVEIIWKTKEYQDAERISTVFAALTRLEARDAIPPLRSLTHRGVPELYRGKAIATLGYLTDKASAPEFQSIVKDPLETIYIRDTALRAYVRTSASNPADLLIDVLRDAKNPASLRNTAASLLVYQEDDRIKDVFHHILKGTPDEELQKTIIDGLGRHGDKESMQLLEDLMQTTTNDATKMIIEDSIDSIKHK